MWFEQNGYKFSHCNLMCLFFGWMMVDLQYGLQHMLDLSCIEVFSERYNSDPVAVKIFGASKSGKLSCFIETFFFFSMMQA
jgi:hypothetical protein